LNYGGYLLIWIYEIFLSMINLTRLWTGQQQPADHLRYGHGSCAPHSARQRKPIVVWNITRTCNLRCIHCYSNSEAAQYPGELDWDQAQAVIEDLAAYGASALLLSGGEPMVHPRFFDILELACSKGLKVTISTNGTRIDAEAARRFKQLGVAYVGISLDGIGEIHDHFRGKVGAFDLAVRGFEHCFAAGQKTGLRLTLTRHNAECIEQILDFIEEKNIPRVCFYHLVPAGRGAALQTLPPEMARATMDALLARVDKWKALGLDREVLTVTQPADGIYLWLRQQREGREGAQETERLLGWNGGGANSSGRGIANIDTQGNVHPDQFWQDVCLGNVKQHKFSDIWEAKAGAAVELLPELRASDDPAERQAKLQGRCGKCKYFAMCGGGFRTRAAFANGHWYGSDPGCYLTDAEIGL